jgi:hypothetical protein
MLPKDLGVEALLFIPSGVDFRFFPPLSLFNWIADHASMVRARFPTFTLSQPTFPTASSHPLDIEPTRP